MAEDAPIITSTPIVTSTPIITPIQTNGQKRKYNNDPLVIHPADHPGITITNVVLTRESYFSWRQSVTLALKAKNKVGFINGSVTNPEDEDDSRQWEIVDAMVRSWIMNTIEPRIQRQFQSARTSQELWQEVQTRYEGNNGPRRYGLQKEIINFQQGSSDLEGYYSKLRLLWDEVNGLKPMRKCTCNRSSQNCPGCRLESEVVQDEEEVKLLQFLLGLGDRYEYVKDQILLQEPWPDVYSSFTRLQNVEKKHKGTTGHEDSAMFFKGDKKGSYPRDEADERSRNRALVCTHCGMKGHKKEGCFRLVGYPEWWKQPKNNPPRIGTDQERARPSYQARTGISNQPRTGTLNQSRAGFTNQTRNGAVGHNMGYCSGDLDGDSRDDTEEYNLYKTLVKNIRDMKGSTSHLAAGKYSNSNKMFGSSIEYNLNSYDRLGISNQWIIDSGASIHASNNLELFETLDELIEPKTIFLADGSHQQINRKGIIRISDYLTLDNVLYVPCFRYSLISVSQMLKNKKHELHFTENTCVMQDPRNASTVIGRRQEGLYFLNDNLFSNNSPSNDLICNNSKTLDSMRSNSLLSDSINVLSCNHRLMHNRLGHASYKTLRFIYPKLTKEMEHCSSCPLAKMNRSSFPNRTSKTHNIFELVHIDLWGPFKEESITNTPYMLTIVDDFSRCTWTYLLHDKMQVFTKLRDFYILTEQQHSKQIKIMRSDNGTEFLNKQCIEFFNSKGIIHQRTCVYTPQQNGVVERKHKHIAEIARSIMIESGLPLRFWPLSMLASTYIINRLPTKVLDWEIPIHKLTGNMPDYTNMKVFGCLVYAANTKPNKGKFTNRGKKCIFVGYPQHQKGYSLYDIDKDEFFTSRDTLFHENIFPYKHEQKPDSPSQNRTIIPRFFDDTDEDENINSPSSLNSNNHNNNTNTDTSTICPEMIQNPLNPTHISPTQPSTHQVPIQEPTQSTTTQLPSPETTHTRKSTRDRKAPSWLKDYTNCSILPPTYPFQSTCSNLEYTNILDNLDSHKEPTSYEQAVTQIEWKQAMDKELQALLSNNTWSLTQLPKGRKPIGCKWTFKNKLNPDGSVNKHKARLVAKGYKQLDGIDFHQKFAPVAKNVTIRILLALAAARNWDIQQIDINNAFLHGSIEEDLYMTIPKGLENTNPNLVCKLNKSIYGLKQSSRQWHNAISNTLLTNGFKRSNHDYCLFTMHQHNTTTCILIYVDDILITGNSSNQIQSTKDLIQSTYPITDLGQANYFLGLEIARTPNGLYINQRKYILDIITDLGLLQSKQNKSPMHRGLKLSTQPNETKLPDPAPYRNLVGRLLYLSLTRPDISFSVQQLSQFITNPFPSHWTAALQVVKYLKGTPSLGLFYPSTNDLTLAAFCDSDWGACLDTRKSLTGFCVFLGDALVAWKTKKQATISRSTAEAEYRAMAATVCELQWIHYLLNDLQVQIQLPIQLQCDNKAAIHITQNPVFHERTKHIDIDCHVVRNKYNEGFINPAHIPSKLQRADILTKAIEGQLFQDLILQLKLKDFHLEGGV